MLLLKWHKAQYDNITINQQDNMPLDIPTHIQEAIANKLAIVALESTIISHGMPYPQNVETALRVEKTVRENGAIPATIGIINGRLKAGLTTDEIEILGKAGASVTKVSRRDLPLVIAQKKTWRNDRSFDHDYCTTRWYSSICDGRHWWRSSRCGGYDGYFRRLRRTRTNECRVVSAA